MYIISIVLLWYKICENKYDAIVTVFPIGPLSFVTFFLVATVSESHWIFPNMINIFMMIKPIGYLTLVFLPGWSCG